MSNYVAKLALGKAADHIQSKPSIVERDVEIQAAIEAVSATSKKHWWRKRPQADIILSAHDRQVLRKVKSRAWYLDRGFQCCCFTVGLDGIIGLIPVVGDVITLFLALNLVRVAARANLPNYIIFKMLMNVFIDFALGLTPVAGDILDILYKANWRNALILEEYLFIRRRDELREERSAGGNYGGTGLGGAAAITAGSSSAAKKNNNNNDENGHTHNKDKKGSSNNNNGSNQQSNKNTKGKVHQYLVHQTLQNPTKLAGATSTTRSGPREYATFIAIPQEA
ncbi:hypothetical protein BDB00DRAFT_982850 [Zychaea mexicana]|uniref:uncharacterized protein n=1 Tax=Zychaea mexicana TaxID=64656 RepID=UPI0022FE6B8C|nr:uncharacterized protein BDB00DRAFT_982850 [Zychaea mexicana]KAI9488149.1 hypothetical protein BDB00DRAFT_982850 [Zychaea mexicana]